jgi:hypothetical protein
LIVVVAIAALWMLWPYYALYDLVNSLNQADPAGLERRIEWTSVRQGLREELSASFQRAVARDKANQGFPGANFGRGLAAVLGPSLIEKLVDAIATPQTLANVIAQQKSADPLGNTTGRAGMEAGSRKNGLHLDMLKYAFFSGSPFVFRVEIAQAATGRGAPMIFLFRWNGDWRLTRISNIATRVCTELQSKRWLPPNALNACQ